MNDTFTVGGKVHVIGQSPTLSTSLQVSGYSQGGLLTFPNIGAGKQRSGLVVGATLIDLANQGVATDVLLFSHQITGGTVDSAFDPTDAELLRCVGVINFATGDFSALADNSVAHVSGLAIPFKCPRGSAAISNVSSSGGLVLVTTILAHGLSNGNEVEVIGVEGVTAANGRWTVRVTSSTAFELLSSAHSGTYVAGTGSVKLNNNDDPRHLYAQIVTRGTPTYAAATDMRLKLHFLQD